ncbi:MAG: indole-3-glycerol phosphate synthase TrpC [Pyrinomonas methylaliphatogenes]|nr:indole-3-glycerol phosphate synthase TrpC [Pyrinomonas methylaliphatogenes]
MSDVLSRILETKRRKVERARSTISIEMIERAARDERGRRTPHSFRAALAQEGINIIAEIKRASPSKGTINADIDPATLARQYAAGGAAAISVLTEEDHFRGSLDDLRAVRAAIDLPILRKDFIFDEFQIYEAAAAGADAVLLIVAALDEATLARLRSVAEGLGMDALVEVHTVEELNRAHACGASVIGVNNRNLRTFEVSLRASEEVAQRARDGVLLVSESGLSDEREIESLTRMGYRAFLIGEALMRAPDPADLLRRLRRAQR